MNLNDKIRKKIKMEMDDIKSHRCKAKTGNWCMDCEIANAKATGLHEALSDVQESLEEIQSDLDYYDRQAETDDFSKGFKNCCDVLRKRLLGDSVTAKKENLKND